MRHKLRLSALLAMTLVTATSRGCARHGRRAAGRHHDDQSGIGRHLVGAGRAIDYGYRLDDGHQSGSGAAPAGRAKHHDAGNDRHRCRAKRIAG